MIETNVCKEEENVLELRMGKELNSVDVSRIIDRSTRARAEANSERAPSSAAIGRVTLYTGVVRILMNASAAAKLNVLQSTLVSSHLELMLLRQRNVTCNNLQRCRHILEVIFLW